MPSRVGEMQIVDPDIFDVDDLSEIDIQSGPREPINNAYVDIDVSNIMESRLRSRTS